MTPRWLSLAGLVFLGCSLAGCGGGAQTVSPEEAKVPGLDELLTVSRAELARRTDVFVEEIRARDAARRKGTLKLVLLPGWFQPLVLPCVHDAAYSKEADLTLPRYVDAAKLPADRDLALHYARFGDHAAAVKLAGGKSNAELDALKLEKNFPIEWTRLLAAYVYGLEQQVAAGEVHAFNELLSTHEQLAKLLDGKAKQSALGHELLARGRLTLVEAHKALQKKNAVDHAKQAETALAAWPSTPPDLQLGGDQSQWALALQAQPHGRSLVAAPPARALDLLQLPVSRQGADAVVLFFDTAAKLSEVLVTYNPNVRRECDDAAEVVVGLNAFAEPTSAGKDGPVVHKFQGTNFETIRCPINETFGGWVRARLKEDSPAAAVPRGLGQVHLDRSLEANRLNIVPQLQAEPLVINDEKVVEKLENPLPAAKLKQLDLLKVEGTDLVREVQFRFRSGQPLHAVAAPLFGQVGLARLSNEVDQKRTYLNLTWEDANTQLVLRLPDDVREPTELTLRDRRDASKSAERAAAVAAHEKAERAERIKAGKPAARLPRKLEQYPLGMLKSELLKFVPAGRGIIRREVDDALLVAFNVPAPQDRPFVLRQLVARFDAETKLSWLRVRYESAGQGAARQASWPQQLFTPWRTAGGAINGDPSPYALREQDLPAQGPAAKFYHWRDDVTEATCLLDRDGLELTVWNRPANDAPPAPFTYLPRGPTGLRLGMTLSEAKGILESSPEPTPDGGQVFRPNKGPFDAVVVWTEGEQIKQIAQIGARFRVGSVAKTTPADLEKSLMTQWGTEIAVINWPSRRVIAAGGVLQALVWHDDATRYRLYWAESENSPSRLWAEWRGAGK